MKKALIFYGGWDGHEPKEVATYIASLLEAKSIDVTLTDDMTLLEDTELVASMHVIVPVVTMDKITKEQVESISEAVAAGTGLIGCHGGMCDAFRDSVLWQFMTGGNWVSHPGGDGITYTVDIVDKANPLMKNIKAFDVTSEQYYLHVDPAVKVLATTKFPNIHWYHSTNGDVHMPVIWTKNWGHGRVYYTSLGHKANIVQLETVTELFNRGIDYVLEGKDVALRDHLTIDQFKSDLQMY